MTVADEEHMLMRSLSINYSTGASEPLHLHEWGQLLYAESGAIRAEIENVFWLVPPRRALWIPARLKHAHSMLGEVKLRTIYVSPEMSSALEHMRVIHVSGLLHEAILRVCARHWLDRRASSDHRLAELIMDELLLAVPTVIKLPKPDDQRANRLIELFMGAEASHSSLAQLIKKAGLSRRTAERLFQDETGISPARWRRLFLLSRAIEYLVQGVSIDEVAERSGYQSRSAFTEAFKQLIGVTPGAIRSRKRISQVWK